MVVLYGELSPRLDRIGALNRLKAVGGESMYVCISVRVGYFYAISSVGYILPMLCSVTCEDNLNFGSRPSWVYCMRESFSCGVSVLVPIDSIACWCRMHRWLRPVWISDAAFYVLTIMVSSRLSLASS